MISKGDVKASLQFERALKIVRTTYREGADDRVLNPPKLSMHLGDDGGWPPHDGFAINMPAYVDWLDAVGSKWAVAAWDSTADIPIHALITLFDMQSGAFKAIIEGMYLTGVRTALQSVIGVRQLQDSSTCSISVIGAGYQAQFQMYLLDALCDVTEFNLFDIDRGTATQLQEDLQSRVEASINCLESVSGMAESDVLITVTDAQRPVITHEHSSDISTIIALGSYGELSETTINNVDAVVVDHIEQCLERGALSSLAEAGQFGKSDIDATIGDVLSASDTSNVRQASQTLFVPIGLGSLDIALAEHVYRHQSRQSGTQFAFR